MNLMGHDGVLVLGTHREQRRSFDTTFPFRASSNMLYLSGFEEPEAVLVLTPGHADGEFTLFVQPHDPALEQWRGRRAGVEGAMLHHHADRAFELHQLGVILPQLLESRHTLFYTLDQDQELDRYVLDALKQLGQRRRKPPGAPIAIQDARLLLHEERVFKSHEERALMRRAAEITSEAHILAMRACKSGMHEYELQAILEFHFQRHGASFPAYSTIVGRGPNATILHYVQNNDIIHAQDLILIDAGCELGGYAADITRTFPASGVFTGAARALYQAVLHVQVATIEYIRPGITFDELSTYAEKLLAQALLDLDIIKGSSLEDILEQKTHKRYYPHGLGHWLGLDVHDPSSYFDTFGAWRTLSDGIILTIEPGLYIPQDDEHAPQAFRGLGVRIEDDILITSDGHEVLTSSCPKHIEDLEAIIGSGLTLTFPGASKA